MKVKKPSLKGMQHTKHLGHFAKDKFIQKGHNDVPDEYPGQTMAEAAANQRQALANRDAVDRIKSQVDSDEGKMDTSYDAKAEARESQRKGLRGK
jgi:hypothetical protein